MAADPDIFDKTIDSLELSVRSATALKMRFGHTVYVRELAMLSEAALHATMRKYHKLSGVIVNDIREALEGAGLRIGMSWSVMPPTKLPSFRNPQQMLAHKSQLLPKRRPVRARKTKNPDR